jgi:uroporphyrinogen decarboxylase
MKDEMTRKERLIAAMKRQPLDRFPVQIDFSPLMLDIIDKAYGVPQRGEEELLPYIDNHIVYGWVNDTYGMLRKRTKIKEKIVYDNFGCGWDMTQEGIFPAVHPLEDESKVSKYEWPNPNEQSLMDIAEETLRRYGKDYIVSSYQVTLLFERAYALRGYENFLCDMMVNEDMAEDILENITKYQVEIAKRYVRLGVTCGRTGDDYGTQNAMLFSPKVWRKLIKPRLKRIVSVYKDAGLPVIHHSCGHVLPIIDDLAEIGIDMLNNVQPESMSRESLMPFADKISFYGGISTQKVLPNGDEEAIYREVKECMETLGSKGGYLLSPGISIISDVSIRNLNILLRALNDLNGCNNICVPE